MVRRFGKNLLLIRETESIMAQIWSGNRSIASADLDIRIARAANALTDIGVQPGDCIAMVLRNDFTFFEVGRAAARCGAFPVTVNWHGSVSEVRYILEDCGARIVIIHADLLRRLGDAIPDGVTIFAVATPPEVMEAYGVKPQDGAVPEGVNDWERWIECFPPEGEASNALPDTIIYTSGTTGKPKGVRRAATTSEQTTAVIYMVEQIFGFDDERAKDAVAAMVGPIYHSAPSGHANYAYAVGADIVIMPKFDPEGLLQAIERHRITHLSMVPIMFARLLKLPAEVRACYDLSSLRFVVHAAAPCPAELKRAMIEWWGPVIHEFYGTTETGAVTICDSREWLDHPGTVGRAMRGADVRVVGPDGRDQPAGDVGEILCRVTGMADFTYHGDDEKRRSAEKFGLIAPGDVGFFDQDGFLHLRDRIKDMIISGGVNIYPAEIESEIHRLPEVADCAVFGIPDEEFGESICAVLQMRPNAQADVDAIRAALRPHLASYKIPGTILFADALPREDSGKIFKRKLREPFWAEHGRSI